jgi:uncharacterized membrane protein
MKHNPYQPIALLTAVAVMLAFTVVVALSRATISNAAFGGLKCYDVSGVNEKAC